MARILAGVSDDELGALLSDALPDYELRFASTANKVLEEARSGSYDLILLDADLFEDSMHGFLQVIRGGRVCQNTPILLLGASYEVDVEPAVQAGASAWVKKPFNLLELRDMVKKYSAWDEKVINKTPKEKIKEKGPFVSFEQAVETPPEEKALPREVLAHKEKEEAPQKIEPAAVVQEFRPLKQKLSERSTEVLLIGLNEEMAKDIAETLRQLGCNIHVAETGREGIEHAARGGLDLVLVSLHLPDLDGFTVCRRLKAPRDLTVFLLLPVAETEDKIDCWKVGAQGYFVEPFDPIEIGSAIEATLSRTTNLQQLSERNSVLEQNIKQLRNQMESLSATALTDSLTGFYNRRYLDQILDREMARARRFHEELSLMMLDLDKFKLINDRFGHRTGDAVLTKFSTDFQALLRKVDMIFRYGGDEFCILLPKTNRRGALWVAEKVRKHFEHPHFFFNNEPLTVTVSTGVAAFSDKDWENGWEMVEAADAALLEAKKRGGNSVVYFVNQSEEIPSLLRGNNS